MYVRLLVLLLVAGCSGSTPSFMDAGCDKEAAPADLACGSRSIDWPHCSCSPRPSCTQGPRDGSGHLSYAGFRGTCDAGEVCLGSADGGFGCVPADFNVPADGGLAPNASGGCDACGRCWFACNGFSGMICPKTCLYQVPEDDAHCADGSVYCFVTP